MDSLARHISVLLTRKSAEIPEKIFSKCCQSDHIPLTMLLLPWKTWLAGAGLGHLFHEHANLSILPAPCPVVSTRHTKGSVTISQHHLSHTHVAQVQVMKGPATASVSPCNTLTRCSLFHQSVKSHQQNLNSHVIMALLLGASHH
jgi:hypothetical protein